MTIRVGFDYDEPLFPWYDYAHDASVAAGLTSMDQDPPTVWDPHSHYGCAIQEWYDVLDAEIMRGPDGMYGRPLKPGVVADMYRLRNRGVEIHIVTARGSFGPLGETIKELTRHQIVSEGVPYDYLHFSKDKETVIRENKIDYFIDDRPEYFNQAIKGGAKSFLLDERWNQQVHVLRGRRVYTTRQYIDRICRNIDEPTGSQIFKTRPREGSLLR